MTYFELMKRINSVFPSTVETDYREVSPEELWRSVYELIDYTGLLEKYTDAELSEIRGYITSAQSHNFRKKTALKINLNSEYNYGFNQNNYSIKQSVLKMKSYILYSLIDKLRLRHDLVIDENDVYNSDIGSIKEIEDYIAKDEICDYLNDLLTISKEDNDFYRETNIFTNEILLNYGISPRSQELNYFFKEISDKINVVLATNNTYSGEKIKSATRITESRYNEVRKTAIEKLANTLSSFLTRLLQNRKKEEFTIMPEEKTYVSNVEEQTPFAEELSARKDRLTHYLEEYDEQKNIMAKKAKAIEELKRLREKELEVEKRIDEYNAKLAGKR